MELGKRKRMFRGISIYRRQKDYKVGKSTCNDHNTDGQYNHGLGL